MFVFHAAFIMLPFSGISPPAWSLRLLVGIWHCEPILFICQAFLQIWTVFEEWKPVGFNSCTLQNKQLIATSFDSTVSVRINILMGLMFLLYALTYVLEAARKHFS